MKRFILCLALGAGVLSACSASQTTQTAAGLSGTYDLTSVGNYVFVTSADHNELRVLNLNSSPRDWVRAPDPIEPLSIPVLERPIYLARDIHYDASGAEVTGPYVYARSTGTDELSVVAADPAYLKEVRRLKGLGFVTAFAGRGADNGGNSVLYYATQEETGARLFRLELPGPEALLGSADVRPEEIILAAPLTDETVTALLVMPTIDASQEHIVVATRKTVAKDAKDGRTFKLDARTGAELVQYNFKGTVRLLATNPRVSNLMLDEGSCTRLDEAYPPKFWQNADHSLNAGTYVYGALDESVCAQQDQESCAGIVAVDADTGEKAVDATNTPMLPVRVGQALPTGLSITSDAHVLMRCNGASTVMRRPLIGIVPASDGRITLFDAASLRTFDFNTPTDADGTLGAAGQSGNAVLDINGTAKTTSREPIQYINLGLNNEGVKEGATRSDTYRVLYEGALGVSSRPIRTEQGPQQTMQCTADHCTFYVENKEVQTGLVRPGDIISLANSNGACVGSDGTTPVDIHIVQTAADGKLPDGSGSVGVLTSDKPLPTELCPDPTRFTVRAGGEYPLVVNSDSKGYLGRMKQEDGTFPIPGGYYYHPNGFGDPRIPDPSNPDHINPNAHDPNFDMVGAYLSLANLGDLSLKRGDQLIVTALSGVLPFAASVDTATTTGGLTTFRLPGPVVHVQVGDPRVDFAYIAYPSANGILQVSLAGLVDNIANLRGLVPFE